MKITEMLTNDTILLELKATEKTEVIEELVAKLHEAGRITDQEAFKNDILARESQGSKGSAMVWLFRMRNRMW